MVEVSDLFKRFDYHYKTHKNEFGNITQQDYLDIAIQAKNQTADGVNIQEKIRSDGSINKYNVETNELVSYSPEGKIFTFFKPDLDVNPNYWTNIYNSNN